MATFTTDPDTGREILMMDAFAFNGQYKVRAKGYSGTAIAGTTTNLDFAIGSQDRYMQGLRVILRNHTWGDKANLQIVDKDNILGYGAGAMLNQFATDWNFDSGSSDQGIVAFTYTARIYAGLYIRIVYTSVGGTNVDFLVNFLLHEKVA